MYSSVIEVLEIVMEDGVNAPQSVEASVLIDIIQSFDFIFSMHVMISILGVSNELSQALQRSDQNIDNAMRLVDICKQRLLRMRNEGWNSLLDNISSFCNKLGVDVPNMDDNYRARGHPKRRVQEIKNEHHYRINLFYTILDMQIQELNDRFSEASTELLVCIGALNPSDSFSAFNKEKVLRLAQLYPCDFSPVDLVALDDQLETYILDMRSADIFFGLHGITALAEKLVETRNHLIYQLVYRLITLTLTLPVATATVERTFSAMKIVKQRLRNRMGDEWLNDCLVPYIEKEVFDQIPNEAVIQYYQNMKTRKKQL